MIISLFTRTFLTTDQNFINKVYPEARIVSTKDLIDNHIQIDTITPLGGFDKLVDYLMKDNTYSYNFIVCRGIKEFKKILCCYFKLLHICPHEELMDFLHAYVDHSDLWKYVCYKITHIDRELIKEKETEEFFIKSIFDMYMDKKYQNEITDRLLSIPKGHRILKEIPVEYMFYASNRPELNIYEIAKKKTLAFTIYSLLSLKNQIAFLSFQNAIPIDSRMILTKEQLEGYMDEKDYYVEHFDEFEKLITILEESVELLYPNTSPIDAMILFRINSALKYISRFKDNIFSDNEELLTFLELLDFGYSGFNMFKINKHLLEAIIKTGYTLSTSEE